MHLARVGGQEMLQGAEHLLNPVTTRPQPQQARGLEQCGETEQVKPILTGFINDNQGDFAIGRTLGPQPGIATAWRMEALPKGSSVLLMHQIRPFDLATVFKVKDIGGFALDQ